jgi:hypothetical protein
MYILGYMKLTKSDKFYSLEMCTIHYKICQNLSFLCSLKYEVVCIEILHHCSIHHWISLEFCFNVLQILKYEF